MPKKPVIKRTVRPDSIDFRDLPFRPNVAVAPSPTWFPRFPLEVKHQEDTNACTGFALSIVVEHLLRRAGRDAKPNVSPFMLYSMARRYDEFPGSKEDEGSSLRGALKGWHKHGACGDALWQTGLDMPKTPKDPADDWWLDAVKRPLGAYYRIDCKQVVDIHSALNEVGIVYASADTHPGWDEGDGYAKSKPAPRSFADDVFVIPPGGRSAGGHAFAIVGYDERGFLVHNSWGTGWGSKGYGLLTYDDWLEHAMDCWVAQLGVVTRDHREISKSSTLRTDEKGRVSIAASKTLRDREISPFIVDMGNNGKLSDTGLFRTQPGDVQALVDIHLAEARARWPLGKKPIDVCIYAHGGLVGEKAAAENAEEWIRMLYNEQIFPVYLMWETDLLTTVVNRLTDAVRDVPRPAGAGEGFWSRAERWWNERIERLLAKPGREIWGEMKQNAHAISKSQQSGAAKLWAAFGKSNVDPKSVRFHLVGHSAGSIVHAHIIDTLAERGVSFESVSFMAPAVRRDTFDELVRPHIVSGRVKRYQQFHLTDKAEEEDPTCGPYRRSLLYLVSRSFEEQSEPTPILGMEKYFDPALAKRKNVTIHVSPGRTSASSTHGGFDNDELTKKQVVKFIQHIER